MTAAAAKTYTYLDPRPLAATTVLWLWIHLAGTIAWALANLIGVGEFSTLQGSPSSDEVRTSDILIGLAGFVFGGSYVVSGFLTLKWTYRVNRNAHAFVRGLSNTPPWSVGWYFVPFAALWKPYQALSEAWRASDRPESWRTARTPLMFRWWWGLWILNSIMGNLSWRLPDETFSQRVVTSGIEVFSAAIEIPLILLLIRIIRGLTAIQVTQDSFGDERAEEPAPLVL